MPESGITKHNYLFCQFVNPARGHEGDRCDCFDTPSQRRTTLAKQRLARLRAKREINRASTSNDPESAVASDPAVTGGVMLRTRLFPLQAQGNEELMRLQVDADTGNLHLLDMLLNLERFLGLAIDRWTACVARYHYAFGSG